jgi:hypothetical protein
VNSSLKIIAKKQPIKKWPSISSSSISNFFIAKNPFKECDVEQQQFVMDLCLLVGKNNFFANIVYQRCLVEKVEYASMSLIAIPIM